MTGTRDRNNLPEWLLPVPGIGYRAEQADAA